MPDPQAVAFKYANVYRPVGLQGKVTLLPELGNLEVSLGWQL